MDRALQRFIATIAATRTIRAVAIIALLVAAHYGAAAQSTITTREGKEYRGTIVSQDRGSLTLKTDSAQITLRRREIREIDYGRGSEAARLANEIPTTSADLLSASDFLAAGMTIGMPSGLNLVVAYYIEDMGLRASGLYMGKEANGIELEILYPIGRYGSFSHNFSFGLGHTTLNPNPDSRDNWSYLKLGYDLNWGGFYISAGAATTSDENVTAKLVFQLGYVNEFR